MNIRYIKYLSHRVFLLILSMLFIITITFILLNFLPGTPYTNQSNLTSEQIHILNEQYGLNNPLLERYIRYIGSILKGDLGTSFQFNNTPVTQIIMNRIGPSLLIGFQAILLGSIAGIVLGIFAAVYVNTWVDHLTTFLAIFGRSIPNFVFAVLLQQLLAIKFDVFPIALWKDGWISSILPSIALSLGPLSNSSRFIRTEMVEALNSNYIELAKSKGLGDIRIAFKHALRNAVIPMLTIMTPLVVTLMTGSMVIEQIFVIPGLGEQFVHSILVNDYPTIMGLTILYSFLLCLTILIVDILYGIIDPRIRINTGGD